MKLTAQLNIGISGILLQSLLFAQSGLSQVADTSATGGGIIERAGALNPYGINSVPEAVLGGNQSSVQGQGEFVTRNYRRGNESGIGSSFMQTNSPTNQSSPAKKKPEISPVIQEIAPLPKQLRSMQNGLETSPALQGELGAPYLMWSPRQVSPALNTSATNIPLSESTQSSVFDRSAKTSTPLEQLNRHATKGSSSPEFFFPGP